MALSVKRTHGYLPQVKAALFKNRQISRSQLSDLLSLTPPTITAHINMLKEAGLVHEIGVSADPSGSLGRRPVIIEYVADATYTIGIELSPYLTSIVIANLAGDPIIQNRFPVAPTEYDNMIEKCTAWISETIAQSQIPPEKILGIGIGAPGFIESENGVIRSSYRIDWNGRHLARDLSKRIRFPVVLSNNVWLRAIGADLWDPTIQARTFAYFYLAQGVACPLIIRYDGLIGEAAGAGEIGHMVVDLNGRHCKVCGNQGCLETVASEPAIIARCQQSMSTNEHSFLHQLVDSPEELTMSHILQAQAIGDSDVCMIMNEAIRYMGVAIANIVNFIKPSLFLIDAYIMKPESNRKQLVSSVQKNLFALTDSEIEIRFVDFDVHRGAMGGCAYALKKFFIEKQQ